MEWRKSSRSGSQSDCVELRRDLSAVRDSKNPDSALTFPEAAVRELITRL